MWLVLRCLIPFIVINHTYHWWVINGGIHLLLQSGGFCNGFGRQHSLWCGKVCRLNKSRWEQRSSGYLTSFFNIRRMLSNISRIDYNSWLTFINSGALEVGHVRYHTSLTLPWNVSSSSDGISVLRTRYAGVANSVLPLLTAVALQGFLASSHDQCTRDAQIFICHVAFLTFPEFSEWVIDWRL